MGRSLVAKENPKPPKELEVLFDDPPLVGNERREDYEKLFMMIAAAVQPADAVEWIMVRDVANLCWEIQRERRIKADIIRLKQNEARTESSFRMTRDDYLREAMLAEGEAEYPSKLFKRKEVKPQAKEEDPASGLAKAYMDGAVDIDAIDRRIAFYEHRRNVTLREIAIYSEAMARKLDKTSRDILDGEFTEAAK